VGCGVQGEIQLAALAAVLPLERAWAIDLDAGRAAGLPPARGRRSASGSSRAATWQWRSAGATSA